MAAPDLRARAIDLGPGRRRWRYNYFGNHESIRFETLMVAELTGAATRYKGFAEQCMAATTSMAGRRLIS
jgi:hypothetical protein